MKPEQPQSIENDPKNLFLHRDLSWLLFNERVLDEGIDKHNPLLERARFLAIFVNNLDEFFMVRVAGLKRLIDSNYRSKDRYGWYPHEALSEIETRISSLITKLYDHYESLRKSLKKEKISLKRFSKISSDQKKYLNRYFENTLFPIVTPMAVDQAHPFPVLSSRTLALAVQLEKNDEPFFAIIPIPSNIPRVVKLPSERGETDCILLEDIIREFLPGFFSGYNLVGSSLFRVIRDSEIWIREEYTPDLLHALEQELQKRPNAKVVHLEVEDDCNNDLLDFLCNGLDYQKEAVMKIQGDLDLKLLFSLIKETERPDLLFQSFIPQKMEYESLFDRINEGDFITHVPYQSFETTIDLIRRAAHDNNVLAIKMTLYRTNKHSAIIDALKTAAKNRKQVTILVELKARFDEERNILWAKELENAGCHVVYGIPGMKIHSKATLIVREEEGRIKRYVHLGTGNYNEFTARVYTDLAFFTSNKDFGRDVSEFFNVITGYSLPSDWKKIVSAPENMRNYFFELVDREIDYQKKYKNGRIFAKMNSLEDIDMIKKLYEASQAGVKIHLLVRGICCLIPGVPGLSETIKVKSLVGRFLEHTRIFLFHANTDERIFLSSADWMTRNFDRRIELLFEMTNTDITDSIKTLLETYWKDTAKTWTMLSKKTYKQHKDRLKGFNAQEYLIDHYKKVL